MLVNFNRYRRKRSKVNTSIFDSALSHTRRPDASEKREENSVSTFERFRLWTSFESSPVSVKDLLRLYLENELQSIYNRCIENCEDSACSTNCRREFSINLDGLLL